MEGKTCKASVALKRDLTECIGEFSFTDESSIAGKAHLALKIPSWVTQENDPILILSSQLPGAG